MPPKKKKENEKNNSDKLFDETIKELHSEFGKDSIKMMKDDYEVTCIPTGSITLDRALGIGGLPRGKVIEVYGPEASGKTSLCLHFIAEVQKAGGRACFIDAESGMNKVYAKRVGCNIDTLLHAKPDTGEDALNMIRKLVENNVVDIVVVDSVAALVPIAAYDGEIGDSHYALHARLLSDGLRILATPLGKTRTTLVFINQLRMNIGQKFGNPEVTPGGRALKFYSTVRLDIRKKEFVKFGEVVVGNDALIRVVKNKVAPPHREALVRIIYGKGLNKEFELASLASEFNIIESSGAGWFKMNGETICQGSANLMKKFSEEDDFRKEIEKKIQEEIKEERRTMYE